jgi:hypothetical protein
MPSLVTLRQTLFQLQFTTPSAYAFHKLPSVGPVYGGFSQAVLRSCSDAGLRIDSATSVMVFYMLDFTVFQRLPCSKFDKPSIVVFKKLFRAFKSYYMHGFTIICGGFQKVNLRRY